MNLKPCRTLLAAGAALALAGCETMTQTMAENYTASLTGAAAVPGPGDPDGAGRAEVTVVDATDNVCYEIEGVRGISPATAAHIHRGAIGEAGPPVLPLRTPAQGASQGCVETTDGLADHIKANPGNYYINIHNAEFPAGALRGQLRPSG
jgi:CHRD domain